MRVLHLYAGNLYGGIEKILATLAREGASSGMQQQFALCFEGRLSDELRSIGVPVHILGAVRMSRPWTAWRARKRLLALVESQQIDVVVAHSSWIWAIFGKALVGSGVSTALWVHTRLLDQEPLDRLARKIMPQRVIALSKDIAGTVDAMFSGVQTEVIYTPVPPMQVPSQEDRERIRGELGAGADEVIIVQVSRMEAWKGHRLHLEALARLKDLPQWTCWIVGGAQRPAEQQYLESMQKLAADLSLGDRVRFLGERRDVPRILAGADIFCQPNLGPEGLGVVFLEALQSRLPVVTTDMGAAPEVVDATCGRLVAPGDPDAVAAALRELLGDAAVRRKLGQQGPARAKALTDPATQMDKLRRVLSEMPAPRVFGAEVV